MAEVAAKHNIMSILVNIAIQNSIEPPPKDALIVFISPIHGFNYPPVMLNYIFRFPKGNNKVLLLNTRAGMLIGRFVTPGLTGIAFYLTSLVLWLKGYSINGMFPVDLPSNWISLHPGLNDRTIKFLHEKNKKRVVEFSEKAFTGKKIFKALFEIVQDLAVSPIAVLYYLVGRFVLSKTFYASAACDNCNACIKNCPVQAIKTVNNRPYWTFNCESCMKCMSSCPKRAIETGHGFVTVVVILNSVIFTDLFYKYLGLASFMAYNEFVSSVIESILFLIFIGICYRIMHYLMKFSFFNRIMLYSSLTKYKFWGRRYKAIKF